MDDVSVGRYLLVVAPIDSEKGSIILAYTKVCLLAAHILLGSNI